MEVACTHALHPAPPTSPRASHGGDRARALSPSLSLRPMEAAKAACTHMLCLALPPGLMAACVLGFIVTFFFLILSPIVLLG